MSHTLSEQEKSLLSAYHDGETTVAEAREARHLLGRSPEARAWLHDAGSVRAMSVEAAHRIPLPLASSKLTGSAIATAAQKGVAISGGGLLAAARSPLGLTGAAALLVAGALFTFQLLQNDSMPSVAREGAGSAVMNGRGNTPTYIGSTDVPDVENGASLIPPITAHDLVGFAVDGLLPINTERTRFVGMDEAADRRTAVIREIEERMATLDKSDVRALDSLAELLRGSVVRLQGNACAVRSDLPDLRMAIIARLEEAKLSDGARKRLYSAREEARENRTRLNTSLEDEMRAMEAKLLERGAEPYVLIETSETVAEPTGDRNGISILKIIGEHNRVIAINSRGLTISEPNASIANAFTSPARKRSIAEAGQTERNEKSNTPAPENFGWRWVADKPFMQSVTINLFSGSAMTIIISDDVDTAWESPPIFVREGIYSVGTKIDELTAKLNMDISRIANDRSESAEVRARKIIQLRREYRKQLQRLVAPLNNDLDGEGNPDNLRNKEDSTKRTEKREEAANRDDNQDEKPIESTCLPWEDCTGLG